MANNTIKDTNKGLSSKPFGAKMAKTKDCIYNQLLLSILQVISQKYGRNL